MKAQAARVAAPTEIAAEPAETRACRACGREFPIDQFPTHGGRRLGVCCRECEKVRRAGGDVRSARADMEVLESIAAAMHGEGAQPEYAINDLLGEIRRGGQMLARQILKAFEVHADIVAAPENVRAINELVESISKDISNTRRGNP